jgi:hypothetical protein
MKQKFYTSSEVNPIVLFNGIKSLKTPLVQTTPQPVVKGKIFSFFLTPKRLNNQSMVNFLKSKFGVVVDGKQTFTTPYLSSTVVKLYNGSQFYISLEGDIVYLKVISNDMVSNECFWNIEDITTSFKSKYPKHSRVITSSFMKEHITEGLLMVKFNVSKTKDHGTLWRVFIIDDEKEIKPIKTGKPVVSDYDDDFFFDL